ncbi:MAG: hypothetical protein ACOC56_04630, partial [Atribacterota bacterium]
MIIKSIKQIKKRLSISVIRSWLDKHGITDYTINDDLSVNVDRSVNLYCSDLKYIPIQFNKVEGNFWCDYN